MKYNQNYLLICRIFSNINHTVNSLWLLMRQQQNKFVFLQIINFPSSIFSFCIPHYKPILEMVNLGKIPIGERIMLSGLNTADLISFSGSSCEI